MSAALNSAPVFADRLKSEFDTRQIRNPRYSLRAFARDLDVSVAALSILFRDRKPPSERFIKHVSHLISLSDEELTYYAEISRQFKAEAGTNYRFVDLEVANKYGSMLTDTILEIARLNGLNCDWHNLANQLGISHMQLDQTVQDLITLGWLNKSEEGRYKDTQEDTTVLVSNEVTSETLRELQIEILEKSATAVEKVDRSQRDHTSMVMRVAQTDLPELKIRIKRFRRELALFCEREEVKQNSVYQLHVGLFPQFTESNS